MSTSRTGGLVLWPVPLILALAGGFLWWTWAPDDPAFRQQQVIRTSATLFVTGLALVVWWTFYSGLRRRTRWIGLGTLVAAGIAALSLVEMRGFSGDLAPRLTWRDARPLPALPPPAAPAEPDAGPAGEPPDAEEPSALPDAEAALSDAEAAPPDAGSSSSATGRATETEPDALPPEDPAPAAAASYPFPQFLGPDRNATLRGVHLARDWSREPPSLRWRQPIGLGWAGFAVGGGLAITQEQRPEGELVVAYDLDTGEPRWHHARAASFQSAMAGDGPRGTPSIHDGRVYAFGATGLLTALDLDTGAVLFERDVLAENGARRPSHGVAASPLILDDLVIVLAGGAGGRSLVAYDRSSGERRWSGGDDPAAYSSPLVARLAGVRQIVVFNQRHVTGHDARDGSVLWQHTWPSGSERVSQPVVLDGDRLFVSTGYGIGGQLLQISRDAGGALSVERLWETRRLKAKFTQVVEHDGYLYGLDDGILTCIDPADGGRRWKAGRYGHGQVLLVDDLLLVQTEDGEVVMVDPQPEELVELGRFRAVVGQAWATPALAGDLLLVRSDREVACHRLPLATAVDAVAP